MLCNPRCAPILAKGWIRHCLRRAAMVLLGYFHLTSCKSQAEEQRRTLIPNTKEVWFKSYAFVLFDLRGKNNIRASSSRYPRCKSIFMRQRDPRRLRMRYHHVITLIGTVTVFLKFLHRPYVKGHSVSFLYAQTECKG